MAIHITSINGMGASTLIGSTITNTGMGAEDHMHLSEDVLNNAGVPYSGDLYVTQNTTPNSTVNVSAGTGYVLNPAWTQYALNQTKYWRVRNDATVNISINPNTSSNPRITSIFLRVDTAVTPDDNATNVASFVAIDGTPASTPTPPATPVDGKGYLRLANITCAPSFTAITNANISNVQPITGVYNIVSSDPILHNGRISATVASNNLTVSIITADGQTPSASNPVVVTIGGVKRYIISATSITINGGANAFATSSLGLNNHNINLFVCLIWDSSTSIVRLGLTRAILGNTYNFYSATLTNTRHLALSGGSPLASDIVVSVGRVNVTLNLSNNYTSVNNVLHSANISDTEDLTYSPTFSGFSTPPTVNYRYRILGAMVYLWSGTLVTGVSNANSFTFTAPFPSRNISGYRWTNLCYENVNNGGGETMRAAYHIASNTTTVSVFRSVAVGGGWDPNGWTASGNKGAEGVLLYKI